MEMQFRSLWLVPVGMLIVALAPLPYGYYTLLRLVVCVCCCVLIYLCHVKTERMASAWVVGLGLVAVLFNPIIRIHLAREVWALLDLASAAFIVAHMIFVHRKVHPPGSAQLTDRPPLRS